MEFMEHIQIDPMYIITASVALIVWFSRLESKTNRNEKDIAKIQLKNDTLEVKLNDIKLALVRIEVHMGIKEE